MINVVKEYSPYEFSALVTSSGIVLCTEQNGAFLVLRFREDVENLRQLLGQVDVQRLSPTSATHPTPPTA